MKPASSTASVTRYRWSVAGRVLAASAGGYALTSTGCSVLAQLLSRFAGVSPAVSVLSTTLLSFAIYTVVVLWMFRARSALRMWGWLGVGIAVLGGVNWALGHPPWMG
ncbi:hypothetical protein [Xanthomonas sp. BRIP62409]|uniref:hypothetical protein n=1 Tax=Xanthomonas sp. BRIP62409 TaxID=2182388 RepID=UPI000F8F6337|nr:hypothetical protein [Xanthomonas sp. BRIP62409]